MADERQRVRWGRISAITIVGLAFTGAPFYLAQKVSGEFGEVHALTSSTLTNIGTAVLLVGIVFFLERSLLQRVSDTAAQTTARVVEERTIDLTNANRALATELADLRAQFEGATAADSATRTEPLRNVTTDVSFDSIAEALETANDFGALEWGTVTVPLVSPSDAPELVTFDWRFHEVRYPDGRRDENRFTPQIRVEYETRRNPGGGIGMPVVEVMWAPDQAPLDLLMSLRAEMVKKGFGLEAKLVSPDLLAHVGVALADAVAGRQVEDGAWVEGALAEWLADGWAITEAGLISRDHGSIRANDFPENELRGELIPFDPPVPEGVSEAFWKFAVDRSYAMHGRGSDSLGALAYLGPRQQPVFTTLTSPRKDSDWPY